MPDWKKKLFRVAFHIGKWSVEETLCPTCGSFTLPVMLDTQVLLMLCDVHHSKIHTDSASSQLRYYVLSTLWVITNIGVTTRYWSCDIIREFIWTCAWEDKLGNIITIYVCERPQGFLGNTSTCSVGEKVFPTRDEATPSLKKEEVGQVTEAAVEIVSQNLPRVSPDVWIMMIISRLHSVYATPCS